MTVFDEWKDHSGPAAKEAMEGYEAQKNLLGGGWKVVNKAYRDHYDSIDWTKKGAIHEENKKE